MLLLQAAAADVGGNRDGRARILTRAFVVSGKGYKEIKVDI